MVSPVVPILGYTPDIDPTTDGAITDCGNMLPTLRGLKAAPSPQSTAYGALAAPCRGAVVALRLDNTRRFFAGTSTRLYEGMSGAWVDRSRAGLYNAGAENRWRFAQFGNVTLACNQLDVMQASTTGAFADIATAPKARIIETVAGFVMAFATVDGSNGDNPDMWWCSGLYDHTAWTPSLSTQAANGRLIDSPGEIRAARRLGDGIVVYKERSMYLGSYVGAPIIWSWQRLPGEIGAVSHEAVLDIGTAHLFVGNDDIWLFDGSRPVSIGAPLRLAFFNRLNPAYRYRVQGFYDRFNGLAYWYYPSKSSSDGTPDSCIVYNVQSQRWSVSDRTIQALVDFVGDAPTYDSIGTLYSTYDSLPTLAFDSPYWFAAGQTTAIINTSNVLQTLTGTPTASYVVTGDIGDDYTSSTLKSVLPRFLKAPASASMTAFYKNVLGDALATNSNTAALYDGKFDLLQRARWHRLRVDFTGEVELAGVSFDYKRGGSR